MTRINEKAQRELDGFRMILVRVPVWKLGVSLSYFPLRLHRPDTFPPVVAKIPEGTLHFFYPLARELVSLIDSGHARQEEVFIGPGWVT